MLVKAVRIAKERHQNKQMLAQGKERRKVSVLNSGTDGPASLIIQTMTLISFEKKKHFYPKQLIRSCKLSVMFVCFHDLAIVSCECETFRR
jgi:hypothetical protein